MSGVCKNCDAGLGARVCFSYKRFRLFHSVLKRIRDTDTFVPVEASLTHCCSEHAPQHAYVIITMTMQGLVVRSVPVHLRMVSVFASSLWSLQLSLSSRIWQTVSGGRRFSFDTFKIILHSCCCLCIFKIL